MRESLSLVVCKGHVDLALGDMVGGGLGFTVVGLNDPRGLSQPKLVCDCITAHRICPSLLTLAQLPLPHALWYRVAVCLNSYWTEFTGSQPGQEF